MATVNKATANGRPKIQVQSGMVAWVDVDGILVDFMSMFNRVLIDRFRLPIPENYIPHGWSWDEVIPKGQSFLDIFDALPSDWVADLKALSGARSFTWMLHKLGCRVILITDVPHNKTPDRIFNLAQHGIYYDEIYFTHGIKKSKFATKMQSRFCGPTGLPVKNVFIDDRALNIIDFVENVPNVTLAVTARYNYNLNDLLKIESAEYKHLIDSTASNHEEMHEALIQHILEHLTVYRESTILNVEG